VPRAIAGPYGDAILGKHQSEMLVMPPNWRRIGIWFLAVVPGSIISVVSLGLFLLFLPLLPHRGDLGLWDARGLSSAEIAVMISGLTFLVSTIGKPRSEGARQMTTAPNTEPPILWTMTGLERRGAVILTGFNSFRGV